VGKHATLAVRTYTQRNIRPAVYLRVLIPFTGKLGHLSRDCFAGRPGAALGGFQQQPAGNACYNCGKPGHISRECRMRGRPMARAPMMPQTGNRRLSVLCVPVSIALTVILCRQGAVTKLYATNVEELDTLQSSALRKKSDCGSRSRGTREVLRASTF